MNLNQTEAHEPGLKRAKHSCSWAGIAGEPWGWGVTLSDGDLRLWGAKDKKVEAV